MDQAFPLSFCILQAIKNWTVGRPRNEANSQALPKIILIFLPIVRNNYFASQSYNHIQLNARMKHLRALVALLVLLSASLANYFQLYSLPKIVITILRSVNKLTFLLCIDCYIYKHFFSHIFFSPIFQQHYQLLYHS